MKLKFIEAPNTWTYAKAYCLYRDENILSCDEIENGKYSAKVKSSKSDEIYDVILDDVHKKYTCSCPFQNNGKGSPFCKHLIAVSLQDDVNRGYVNLKMLGCNDRRLYYFELISKMIAEHFGEDYYFYDQKHRGMKNSSRVSSYDDSKQVEYIKKNIPELAEYLAKHADDEYRISKETNLKMII